MKTLLVADKLGGKPLHHEQISKSFVLNMVNFLYMQMTQQVVGGVLDTTGGTRNLYYNQSAGTALLIQPMGAPGGNPQQKIAATHWEQLGIRLGTGLVAPTPTDSSILSTMIPNSWQPPEGGPVLKMAYDWLGSNPGSIRDVYGVNWVGSNFHVREPVSVTGANMRFIAIGNVVGMTLTISLRQVFDDKTNFASGDLASGTYILPGGLAAVWPGQLLGVTFGVPYVIHPGYQYVLVARISAGDGSNKLEAVRGIGNGGNPPTPDHAGLDAALYSTNSGVTWTAQTDGQYGYQVLGQTPLGLAYSGTKLFPPTVSGASAQFILEALFSNYSGASITANEVALMCYGNDSTNMDRALSYMLAHDLLSVPITVNNGEILRIRYIPTITV